MTPEVSFSRKSQIDYKALRAELRRHLDREQTARLLAAIGVGITRQWRFADDPSFAIRKDGLIHDFGRTAFSGDLVAFLHEQRGVLLSEAMIWTAECLGIDHEHFAVS